jgi:ribosomal protein L32
MHTLLVAAGRRSYQKKQQRRKNTWKLRAISTIGIGIGN